MPIALVLVSTLAFRMAWLVLARAAHRRDGRMLALIFATDGITAAYFAVRRVTSHSFDDGPSPLVAVTSAAIVSCGILGFAHAFPDPHRAPPKGWTPGVALAATTAIASSVWTRNPIYAQTLGFACGVLAGGLLLRSWWRLRGTRDGLGASLILAAFSLRFLMSVTVILRGPIESVLPGVSPLLFEARRTIVPIAADILGSMALLHSQLLGVWSITAKAVLSVGIVAGTLLLTALAIEGILATHADPMPLRAGLLATSAIPVAMLVLWTRFGARLEDALLTPFDPARAARREALEQVSRAAAQAMELDRFLAVIYRAIHQATGAEARFVPQAEISVSTDAEISIPVHRAAVTHGYLILRGGEPERDALETASAIADQLAIRLEHESLFSDRMRMATELHRNQQLATLGSFAAAMAHDIRTPLTSVQMNVQILASKVRLDPDDMEHFEIALAELGRLDATVGTVLEYAKPVQLVSVAVDLERVLTDLLRSLHGALAEKRLEVERTSEARSLRVRGDAQKLRRAFQNLLTNAIEASPEGGTIVLRTTRLSPERGAVEIRDEGTGVRPADRQRIFEPFFTSRTGGTGLGLAIVDRFVRAHGGEVEVESGGAGAAFTVVLPIVEDDAREESLEGD